MQPCRCSGNPACGGTDREGVDGKREDKHQPVLLGEPGLLTKNLANYLVIELLGPLGY